MLISLDAMGGDNAPQAVVTGAGIARERYPDARFVMFGDTARIEPLLQDFPDLKAVTDLRHAPDTVLNDDKPGTALRRRRDSSMWHAIQAVKSGEAAGVVSGGNTGALMAMAKFILRPLEGVDRPAIASIFPTRKGESIMLDLGANVQCDAHNLVQFAVMGSAFASLVLDKPKPSVALLNIGEEDLKGTEVLKEAADILREPSDAYQYFGFIEGDGLTGGQVDVVVTDGFTGNIALKTAEGASTFILDLLQGAFRSTWMSKLGFVLARPALRTMKRIIDPARRNGGVFLGLDGVAVKSHGGSDAQGVASAIGFAIDMARDNISNTIRLGMTRVHPPSLPKAVAAT